MVIEISTDGSCYPNPGPGGWACIFRVGDRAKVLYGYDSQSTNIRMEMTAAIRALEHLKRGCDIILYTDSKFTINGITDWIKRWKKNGYKTQPTPKKPSQDVANQDLWKRLDLATQRHNIQWIWVRGHHTNKDNILCDQYAGEGRKKQIEGSLDLSPATTTTLSIGTTISKDFDIFAEIIERDLSLI